jgi:hypothetical protein
MQIAYANCPMGHVVIKELDAHGNVVSICLLYYDREEPKILHGHVDLHTFLSGITNIWVNVTDPYPMIRDHLKKCVLLEKIHQCLNPDIPLDERITMMSVVEDWFRDSYFHNYVVDYLLKANPPTHIVQALNELPEQGKFGELIRMLRGKWNE